jgi:hypothetical protein
MLGATQRHVGDAHSQVKKPQPFGRGFGIQGVGRPGLNPKQL